MVVVDPMVAPMAAAVVVARTQTTGPIGGVNEQGLSASKAGRNNIIVRIILLPTFDIINRR